MENIKCNCGCSLPKQQIGQTIIKDKLVTWMNCLTCKTTLARKRDLLPNDTQWKMDKQGNKIRMQ